MEGSITVFLTLILGVVLSIVTATFENVRFLTADAYVASAAKMAAMSVFGDYNRELYQEYGLFAYGGWDGKGSSTLSGDLLRDLSANLQTKPDRDQQDGVAAYFAPSGDYSSLYRIDEVDAEILQTKDITDSTVFYQQIDAYLQTQVVMDLTEKIKDAYQGMSQAGGGQSIQENLDMTEKYERGEYQETEDGADSAEDGTDPAETEGLPQPESTPGPDHAGGNPLETVRELLRDGILNLVCDAGSLSDEMIDAVYGKENQTQQNRGESLEEGSTADMLKTLLKDRESLFGGDLTSFAGKQGRLVCYAQHILPSYTNSGKQQYRYGLEYLISGSAQERDNLQGVVSRLFVIRTVMNYIYVQSDAGLQTESLATAAKIAGAIGLPVLVTAIQQTILLILSAEESCVDITALLADKSVPLWKNASSFQMKYAEICGAGKALFQAKANAYKNTGKAWTEGKLNYQQYLWLFMMLEPEKQLRLRTYDLIQNDLQTRYNPTFSLEHCISGFEYRIHYRMPFLWKAFLPKGQNADASDRSITDQYDYH